MFGGLVEAPLIPTDNKYQVWFPNISNLYQNFLSFLNLVVVDIPFFFFCVREPTIHLFSLISLDNPQYTIPQVLLLPSNIELVGVFFFYFYTF